jgi:hypothetical protein
MSEAVPATLILAVLLLLTSFTFFSVVNLWTEHNALLSEVAALEEHRLETSLDIDDVTLSQGVCPNYSGPFDATVVNDGATGFTELDQMDVFVNYLDESNNQIVSRLQHDEDWSLSGLNPDNRNPNHWDSLETGTVTFSVMPGLKPETSGVVLIAAPQGVSDSRYFTCPDECNGVTGLLSPSGESADTGGSGDGFEISPANAFADDGNAASSEDSLLSGDNHRFFNYGFSIVDSCAIQGIEVRLDWWLLHTTGDNSMDVELSWDGGSSWTPAKTDFTETTTEHTVVLGSNVDTWGRTWSPSEFSDSNFRVRVTTSHTDTQTFFLDWVAVNVYFAPP